MPDPIANGTGPVQLGGPLLPPTDSKLLPQIPTTPEAAIREGAALLVPELGPLLRPPQTNTRAVDDVIS